MVKQTELKKHTKRMQICLDCLNICILKYNPPLSLPLCLSASTRQSGRAEQSVSVQHSTRVEATEVTPTQSIVTFAHCFQLCGAGFNNPNTRGLIKLFWCKKKKKEKTLEKCRGENIWATSNGTASSMRPSAASTGQAGSRSPMIQT